MEKLVSIVLPVYNGEKYLRESIDSVLNQTYKNWELLIVDDCSKDSTPQIAAEYVQLDSRILYYRNENNLKLPRNLNKGFRLAKGDYLTWTSDDNLFRPTAIARMLEALQNTPNAHFVFASCQYIDSEGKNIETYITTERNKKRMVGINGVRACFMYTRKAYETVGEYDHDCILVEDFDYWQRICARFDSVVIEDVLYDYRLHGGSLTGNLDVVFFNQQLEKILLKNRPLFGKLNTEQKYYLYAGLYDCRVSGKALKNPYQIKYFYYRTIRNVYFAVRHLLGSILA